MSTEKDDEFKTLEQQSRNIEFQLENLRRERNNQLMSLAMRFDKIIARPEFTKSNYIQIHIRNRGYEKDYYFPHMPNNKDSAETYLSEDYQHIDIDLASFSYTEFIQIVNRIDGVLKTWEYELDHKDLMELKQKIIDNQKLLAYAQKRNSSDVIIIDPPTPIIHELGEQNSESVNNESLNDPTKQY